MYLGNKAGQAEIVPLDIHYIQHSDNPSSIMDKYIHVLSGFDISKPIKLSVTKQAGSSSGILVVSGYDSSGKVKIEAAAADGTSPNGVWMSISAFDNGPLIGMFDTKHGQQDGYVAIGASISHRSKPALFK